MQPSETVPLTTAEIQRIAQIERNQAAVDLLRSWLETGDVEEQHETGTYLIRALEEDPIAIGRAQNDHRA